MEYGQEMDGMMDGQMMEYDDEEQYEGQMMEYGEEGQYYGEMGMDGQMMEGHDGYGQEMEEVSEEQSINFDENPEF